MDISIEDKIKNIKMTMENIVKKLQNENKKCIIKENQMIEFFNEHNVSGYEHLSQIITIYYDMIYKESDYIKELDNIKHDLFINKLDLLSIRTCIYKYKKSKIKTDNLIKRIKEINKVKLSLKFNKISQELTLLEKEFEEWCNIPKCAECNCDFDNNNIPLEVKKYGFSKLCRKCINSKLEQVIENNKSINVQLSEEHKKSEFFYKLTTKNFKSLTLYSELYEKSIEENYDLYDNFIISLAGFNPESPYDKYKLGNLCYRSNKLIKDFGERIKYFDVTESELARMGKLEFEALYNVTKKVINYNTYDNLMDKLNIGNNEPSSDIESDNDDDYIPEPDYESDNDAMSFSRSLLQRKGLTKVIF